MPKHLFQSPRLNFRQLTPEDAGIMLQFHSIPEVMRHLGMPVWNTREESLDYIFKNLNSYSKFGYGRWVLEDRRTGEWLGLAGLLEDEKEHFIDLGYRLFPKYWGLGLATEAAGAVLKYGFEELKLEEIKAHVAVQNVASENVLKKIGMQLVGEGVCMGIAARLYELDAAGYQKQVSAESRRPE